MDAQPQSIYRQRRRRLGVIIAASTSLLAISAGGILTLFHHHRNSSSSNNNITSNNDQDHHSVRRRMQQTTTTTTATSLAQITATEPPCEALAPCSEVESTCTKGTETCCGKTYDSFKCFCGDNGSDSLQYMCFYTDACMMPRCDTTSPATPALIPPSTTGSAGEPREFSDPFQTMDDPMEPPVIVILPIHTDPTETTPATTSLEFSDPFPSPHTDPTEPSLDDDDDDDDERPGGFGGVRPGGGDGDDSPQLSCMDDPTFLYQYKKKETVSCQYIGKKKPSLCHKQQEGSSIKIGIEYCPESCGMVGKCLGEDSSGEAVDPRPTEETKRVYWWAVEDENGRKTDCVYNSDYPDLAKQFLFYTEYLCRTKLDEIATTASTTTATTTSLITTKTEATATTSNTVAADTTTSSTTTTAIATTSNPVATQSSTTVAADSRPEYWYSIEAPNGIKTCVHNADYPEEYETSSTNSTSLFFSEAVCQTFIEATSITSSTEATTITKLEYWWPIEPEGDDSHFVCVYGDHYPDDYTHHSVRHFVLFNSEVECCSTYNDCQEPTTTTTTTIPNDTKYWYPKVVDATPTCVHDTNYPAEYTANAEFRASFLFNTQLDCCAAFPSACLVMFWYPNEARTECLFGDDYPDSMREHDVFFGEGECCAFWSCGGDGGSGTTTTATTTVTTGAASTSNVGGSDATLPASTVAASSSTTTTTTSTTPLPVASTTTPDPCTDCTWHESITAYQTCTNSLSYPSYWDEHAAARAYFFFETHEECCETRFPSGCTVEDLGSTGDKAGGGDGGEDGDSEFTTLGPRTIDNFDGPNHSLPFDFGGTPANPQWKLDSGSLTNIPTPVLGASSDLTLKISVANPSTISCRSKIDTSMPFEMFALFINGQQRNTYHQPSSSMVEDGGWITILTGIRPGENTVVFRVQNADFDAGMERKGEFGSGRIWIDDCVVSSLSSR